VNGAQLTLAVATHVPAPSQSLADLIVLPTQLADAQTVPAG
jgi:hypothetical protein